MLRGQPFGGRCRGQRPTTIRQGGQSGPDSRCIGIAGVLLEPVPQFGRAGVVGRVEITVGFQLTQQVESVRWVVALIASAKEP